MLHRQRCGVTGHGLEPGAWCIQVLVGPALGMQAVEPTHHGPVDHPQGIDPRIRARRVEVRRSEGRKRLRVVIVLTAVLGVVLLALGLLFTPWRLDRPLLLAGAITLAAVTLLYAAFRAGRVGPVLLSVMAGFYALFVGLLVLT